MADNGVPPIEEDPAAAFLAQQENEIAVIENDGVVFAALQEDVVAPEPQPEAEPEPELQLEPEPELQLEPEPVPELQLEPEPELQLEPEPEPELEPEPDPPQEPVVIDSFDPFEPTPAATMNGDMFEETNGPTDGYAAIAQVDQLRQEPESLRRWREEQKARLEELDSASKAAEAEWKEKAKKELEDWYVHLSDQLEKNKANNRLCPSLARALEDTYLSECDGDSAGSEWVRVASLCDFNPKTNKQAKDVSRMRSVLLSLKKTPR